MESILRALGEDAAAFLAAKAACDPEAGDPNAEIPRVALELLASRGGGGGARKGSPDAPTLARSSPPLRPTRRGAAARAPSPRSRLRAGRRSWLRRPPGQAAGRVRRLGAPRHGDVVGDAGASTGRRERLRARRGGEGRRRRGRRGDAGAPAPAARPPKPKPKPKPSRVAPSPRAALTRLVAAMRGVGSDAVGGGARVGVGARAAASPGGADARSLEHETNARLRPAGLSAEILATTRRRAPRRAGARAWRPAGLRRTRRRAPARRAFAATGSG